MLAEGRDALPKSPRQSTAPFEPDELLQIVDLLKALSNNTQYNE
jgi:hypothetical protein